MYKLFYKNKCFIIYSNWRQIGDFSTMYVNSGTIFNKVCLVLLNDMLESETKYNTYYGN